MTVDCRRAFRLVFRTLFAVVKDGLETLVDGDLLLVFLWLSKARVSAQTSKAGVGHGCRGQRASAKKLADCK